MEQPIIFNQVGKIYNTDLGKKKAVALASVSFSVRQGEVFGIIGPNGAGKSTALKILMGFVRPSSGTVTLQGRAPAHPASRTDLGYLPENPCLYEHLSAAEHLRFAGRTSGLRNGKAAARIAEVLEMVDLAHAADLPVRRYSKGMVQRAALAFALVHEPSILILDEPMSGLDPLGRQLVIDIISDYKQKGTTILFCSHILTDVERICDRIAIMDQGRLLTVASPEELTRDGAPSLTEGRQSPLEAFFLQAISKTKP